MRAPASKPLRVLVDNSALRLFALRDPTARATNRLMRQLDVVPVLTMLTVGEIFKGLILRPDDEALSRELRKRCAFVLALERLTILPDVTECVWLEYLHGRSVERLSPHPDVPEVRRRLRLYADGGSIEGIAEAGRAYYAEKERQYREAWSLVVSHESHAKLRGRPFSEAMAAGEIEHLARGTIENEAVRRGTPISYVASAKAAIKAAWNPSLAPYIAGNCRVQAWFAWRVAQVGSIRPEFRDDLILLGYSLFADHVLSNDADFFKYGPEMFPEVEFVSPCAFLKHG